MYQSRCIAASLLLVLPVVLAAQRATRTARPPTTPATPQPPLVTVTKTDGSLVRGRLASSDPKSLSIVPTVKGGAPGDPIEVPWTEVKTVSHGLTQQRAIDQWKRAHPEDRCGDCHGDGTTVCATCKGTGRAPSTAADCPTCHGELLVACTAPKCDHGKVPCPAPCLKLSEGKWTLKPDGKRWRRFPSRRGGFAEVSDGHLGQIVEIKNGEPQPPVHCPTCQGEQKIDCPTCHGTQKAPCPDCTKAATQSPCPDCKKGQVDCKTCAGTGLKSLAT